jgi:hypothetical protein
VLSSHEQRAWDDIERLFDVEAEEPPRTGRPATRHPDWDVRGPEELPAATVAGIWSAILLILLGAPVAGLVVAGVTALGWVLWRYWPRLTRFGSTSAVPVDSQSGDGGGETGGSTATP